MRAQGGYAHELVFGASQLGIAAQLAALLSNDIANERDLRRLVFDDFGELGSTICHPFAFFLLAI